jgi:hypothetical protein
VDVNFETDNYTEADTLTEDGHCQVMHKKHLTYEQDMAYNNTHTPAE